MIGPTPPPALNATIDQLERAVARLEINPGRTVKVATAPDILQTLDCQYYGCYETAVEKMSGNGLCREGAGIALMRSLLEIFPITPNKERLYIYITALLEIGIEKEYVYEQALQLEDVLIVQLFTLELPPTKETLLALANEHKLSSLTRRLLKPAFRLQFEEEAKDMSESIEKDPINVYRKVCDFYAKFPNMATYVDPINGKSILFDAVFTYLHGRTVGIFEALYFLNQDANTKTAGFLVTASKNIVLKKFFELKNPTYDDLRSLAKAHPFADRELVRWIESTDEVNTTESLVEQLNSLTLENIDETLRCIKTLKDPDKRHEVYVRLAKMSFSPADCMKIIRAYHATDGIRNALNEFCYTTACRFYDSGGFIDAKEVMLCLSSGSLEEQKRRDELLIKLSEQLRMQGEFAAAFECLTPIKPWKKLRHGAVLALGRAHIEGQRWKEALKVFRTIDERHYASVREDCLKDLAGRCIGAKVWDIAINAINSILHDEKSMADLMDKLIETCLNFANVDTAAVVFGKCKRPESDYAKQKLKETAGQIFIGYQKEKNETGAKNFLKTMVYTHMADEFELNGVAAILGFGIAQMRRTKLFSAAIVEEHFEKINKYFIKKDRESAVHKLRTFVGKNAELANCLLWLLDKEMEKKNDKAITKIVAGIIFTILEDEFKSNGIKAAYRRRDDYIDKLHGFAIHLASKLFEEIKASIELGSKANRIETIRKLIQQHANADAFDSYTLPEKPTRDARKRLIPEVEKAFKRMGLPVTAGRDKIREQYKKKSRLFHPDCTKRFDGEPVKLFEKRLEYNTKKFAKISAAYKILEDNKLV